MLYGYILNVSMEFLPTFQVGDLDPDAAPASARFSSTVPLQASFFCDGKHATKQCQAQAMPNHQKVIHSICLQFEEAVPGFPAERQALIPTDPLKWISMNLQMDAVEWSWHALAPVLFEVQGTCPPRTILKQAVTIAFVSMQMVQHLHNYLETLVSQQLSWSVFANRKKIAQIVDMFYQSTTICNLCVCFSGPRLRMSFSTDLRGLHDAHLIWTCRVHSLRKCHRGGGGRMRLGKPNSKPWGLRTQNVIWKRKTCMFWHLILQTILQNSNSSLNAVEELKWYWCELKWVKSQQSMSSFFRRKFPRWVSWFHDSGLACSNTSQALSLHFRNFDCSGFLVGHAAMLMMMRFLFKDLRASFALPCSLGGTFGGQLWSSCWYWSTIPSQCSRSRVAGESMVVAGRQMLSVNLTIDVVTNFLSVQRTIEL